MITLHLPADRQRHLIQATWRVNRWVFMAWWAIGAVTISYGGLRLIAVWQARHTLEELTLGVTAFGFVALTLPSYGVWRYRRRLKKLPLEPCSVTINDERFFVESPSVNGDFAWTLVSSVLESRDSFIIRQGRLVRAVLPKAEFFGDDLPAFRRLLASKRLARP